jgi:hypothetical protein
MEPISEDLKKRILAAVEQWVAHRYEARLKDVPAQHIAITRSVSDSEYDYLVSLDSLVGSAPLRVKVTVGQDGSLHVSD